MTATQVAAAMPAAFFWIPLSRGVTFPRIVL
jgi:hypothetical protein